MTAHHPLGARRALLRLAALVGLVSLAACGGGATAGTASTTNTTAGGSSPPTAAATTSTSTTLGPGTAGTTTSTTTTAPGGGAWKMTFEATYAVENYRICNDSLGADCPATAEVKGSLSFGDPTGSGELYLIDAGTAEQSQTSTYNDPGYGCGTRTGAATLAVDVSVTRQGSDFLFWFGGGGYTDGPFIDTVFLGAGCETGPQPAVFWFEDLVVPAQPGTYQFSVADFSRDSGVPLGRVTTLDFSPHDSEPRIQLTVTLARE